MEEQNRKMRDPDATPGHAAGYTYRQTYGFVPEPPVVTQQQMIRAYSRRIGLAVIVYFILSYFVSNLEQIIVINQWNIFPALRPQIARLAAAAIPMAVPFAVYALSIRMPPSTALPLRRAPLSLTLGAIAVTLAAAVIGSTVGSMLRLLFSFVRLIPIVPDLAIPEIRSARILFLTRVVLVAPLIEEAVFRGAVLQSLRRFGDAFALLASSILFSLIHANFMQMPNAFLAGLVLGCFVLRSGSLWTGIAAHMVNNAALLFLTIWKSGMADGDASLLDCSISIILLLGGIAAMLILLKNRPGMVAWTKAPDPGPSSKWRALFLSFPMVLAILAVAALASQYMIRI